MWCPVTKGLVKMSEWFLWSSYWWINCYGLFSQKNWFIQKSFHFWKMKANKSWWYWPMRAVGCIVLITSSRSVISSFSWAYLPLCSVTPPLLRFCEVDLKLILLKWEQRNKYVISSQSDLVRCNISWKKLQSIVFSVSSKFLLQNASYC